MAGSTTRGLPRAFNATAAWPASAGTCAGRRASPCIRPRLGRSRQSNVSDARGIIVANRPGAARGCLDWQDFEYVQAELEWLLRDVAGARVGDPFACGYREDRLGALTVRDHSWRRPSRGMLTDADSLTAKLAFMASAAVTRQFRRDYGLAARFASGFLDVKRLGHIRLLEDARAPSGSLIVALNTGDSVRHLKCQTRPIQTGVGKASTRSVRWISSCLGGDTPFVLTHQFWPNVFIERHDTVDTRGR